ncbi:hypothetical protein M1D30_11250 [Prevotella sp. E15-22]|uniref:hypothetical protein n=1 Tax=Prevotella sp. E15-22 TaxID=2937774 RepID=UPI0020510EB3|nr:hypothetical protein [Prevotella sp. E15-22]UPS44136.1 hypothetical protein M1D30_11250 [Prevotella sp. E15-22]
MTKNNARMLTTILTCCLILVSCSNNDNSSEYIDHISGRTYHLDQKVVNRRECHALKMIANDALNLKFRQIVFEYTSVGPDLKTPVRLTGVISMNPAVYNKDVAPRGLMLYNEFTCAKHGERTSQNELDDIGLYMNKYQNLIMVSADLYGWTLTEDKPQAYCCPEITSVETIDAWDAAMQILKDEGYAISGLPTFNVGYSSGGFSALAVQRYCDEKRPDLHWNLTSGGAAPFDLHSVYISNITSPTSGYACSFPLVVVAYKETYHMDFDYKDVFVEPLASNIQKWILSKDYGTWDINKLIAGGDEAKAKDCPVNLILTPDALNPQSVVGKKLAQKLRENSLCGEGQNWQPSTKTKYYIMHSAGDKYMDWHVGEEMANYLKGHGCNVETEFGDWGNHVDYGLFQHIGKTILLMEDCMPDKDATREQAIKDAIDKAEEYIRDQVSDMTGIPL